jgi:hypothetical protein
MKSFQQFTDELENITENNLQRPIRRGGLWPLN